MKRSQIYRGQRAWASAADQQFSALDHRRMVGKPDRPANQPCSGEETCMKIACIALVAMFCLAISGSFVRAADSDKEVTKKGTALCAKCELKKTDKCQTALKVTEDGKEVVYYLKDASGKTVVKDYHKGVCSTTKDNVTVTGVVSDKDGQKWITVSKIES
jgi:hypothetical protein